MENNNKKKKKSGGSVILILLLIIVIVVAIFMLDGFGLGFGNGENGGDVGDTQSVMAEIDETEPESNEPEVETEETEELQVIDISVSGNDYLFQNKKMSLDEIIEEIKSAGDVTINIIDDNASIKAYENLSDTLRENDIEYIEKE